MLVLGRKAGETIHIDGQIKVTVVKVSGNRVRIGIEAPASMQIVRGELTEWNELSFDHTEEQQRPTSQALTIEDRTPDADPGQFAEFYRDSCSVEESGGVVVAI
jgi:carbon storage regulator CsrA